MFIQPYPARKWGPNLWKLKLKQGASGVKPSADLLPVMALKRKVCSARAALPSCGFMGKILETNA